MFNYFLKFNFVPFIYLKKILNSVKFLFFLNKFFVKKIVFLIESCVLLRIISCIFENILKSVRFRFLVLIFCVLLMIILFCVTGIFLIMHIVLLSIWMYDYSLWIPVAIFSFFDHKIKFLITCFSVHTIFFDLLYCA